MGSKQNDLDPPSLQSESPPPLSPQSSDKHMELSSKLETILSHKEVPLFHRLQSATWIELKLLFKLAAPAIFVYLVSFGMSTSTQIFSGHLGNLELAAASLGNNGIQLFAFGLLFCRMRNGSDRVRMLHRMIEHRLPSCTCTKSVEKDPGGGVPS
ncbi:hypothetical protein CsSME_00027035 [Camellia sinensis var. sinensis]